MGYETRRQGPIFGPISHRGRRPGAPTEIAPRDSEDKADAAPSDPARGLVLGVCVATVFWALVAAVVWWLVR